MKSEAKRHSICDSDKVVSSIGPVSFLEIVSLGSRQLHELGQVAYGFVNIPSVERLGQQEECQTLTCA